MRPTARMSTAPGLALLILLGLLLLAAGEALLGSARVDLTDDREFTLSEGSLAVLAKLQQPVELLFFRSERSLREAPSMRNFALRVENLLAELVQRSHGKLRLRAVDPEPFSAEEDRAAELRIQAVPLQAGGDPLYLGLAAVGSGGREEVIGFFHPERAASLEYDIVKAIYLSSLAARPKVGLISGLRVGGGFDMATRSLHKPWASVQELRQHYEVVDLSAGEDGIGQDIELLLLIHPAGLSERALFAIDQFVLAGGAAMVFVDPYAESALPAASGLRRPGSAAAGSDLAPLFRAWGIELEPGRVVADAAHALLVNLADDQAPARNPVLLGLVRENMATDSPVTRRLERLNFSTAGAFRALPGSATRWQPLVWTSRAADLLELERVATALDPAELFTGFVPDGQRHALVGFVSGQGRSAFPAGLPGIDGSLQQGQIRVLVAADTDVLTDPLWVEVQSFFGERVLAPFADNGSLLINGADWLVGSPDLIAIRSRGVVERPFTRVHELRRQAEERHRGTLAGLKQQLQETEQQLTALSRGADGAAAVHDPGQQAAVDRFIAQQTALRRSLRDVQHQLNRDIEDLGTRLKLINIGLVPLLLTLLLLGRHGLQRLRWR